MNKKFKTFVTIWIIELVCFIAVTFLVPNKIFDITRFDKSVFWIGFALIVLAFAIELITAHKSLNDKTEMKTFFKLPLMQIVCISVTICFAVGLLFMLLPIILAWIGGFLCLLLAFLTIVACNMASATVNHIDEIEQEVKEKTFFIKKLAANAEGLIAYAKDESVKEECIKVYEAVRYSDPMSDVALKTIENYISDSFLQFTKEVKSNDVERVKRSSEKLLAYISERNAKCKLLK